jgi:hypothetical protein
MSFKLARPQIDPVVASRIIFVAIISLMLFFAGTTYYLYNKLHTVKSPAAVLAEKIKKNPLSILETVGQFIELPQGEDPVIATVTDPKKLQDQEFFKKAQTGDKVIVFSNAKLAILFRPSTNKIIQAGPGIYKPPSPTPVTSLTPSVPVESITPTIPEAENIALPTNMIIVPTTEPSTTPMPSQ